MGETQNIELECANLIHAESNLHHFEIIAAHPFRAHSPDFHSIV